MSKDPPLLLSQTADGVAVHADLPTYDSTGPVAITWLSMRVENLGKRYVRIRSSDIRLELPDGQRFPPMTPEMAREKLVDQLERGWNQAQPPGYGSEIFTEEVAAQTVSPQDAESTARPSGTKVGSPPAAASSEHPVLRGFMVATCVPAYVGMLGFLPALAFLPLGLAVAGVGYDMGEPKIREMVKSPSQQPRAASPPERHRLWLNDDLGALRDVELRKGETATASLSFPVAAVVVLAAAGAALRVPFVDWDGKELVVRLLLTTPQ